MDATERAAWLTERRTGLGATDLASVLGVGFRSAAEVYADKAGEAALDREPAPLMAMGLATEEFNASLYAKRTGARLATPGLIRSKSEPWAFATFDRARLGREEWFECPVELKYTMFFGDEWGPDGTDQVRDGYIVQAVWQCAILRDLGHDVTRTDLSVLAGTGEHRVYHIPFDEHLGRLLFEVGRSFWLRVAAGAGVADWQPPLADAIAERLATIRPETTTPLGDDALALVEIYEQHKAKKGAAEEAVEAEKGRMKHYEQLIRAQLGEFETGVLPDGRRVTQKTVQVKAHMREASSHVRFSILKPKKGKL